MIAVDANILVYAHRADSPFHDRARLSLESLAVGARAWAIPWPCAHEFFAVVTHPRIYKTATPASTAFAQLRALQALANLVFIAEADDYFQPLEPLALVAKAHGGGDSRRAHRRDLPLARRGRAVVSRSRLLPLSSACGLQSLDRMTARRYC